MTAMILNPLYDEIAVARRPKVTGTSSPNAAITLYESNVGNKIWGSTYADASGNWTLVPSEDLPLGRFGLVVSENGEWSNNRYVRVRDWEFLINTPEEDARVIRRPTISGISEPDSKIDIYESNVGNKIWGSGHADKYGFWTITLSENLPGTRFGLVANDGKQWSNNRYVTVTEGILSPTPSFSLLIWYPYEDYQVPRRPTVAGFAEPNSKIDIYEANVGNKIWGSGYTDPYGYWSIDLPEDLPETRFGLVASDGKQWSNNRYVNVSNSSNPPPRQNTALSIDRPGEDAQVSRRPMVSGTAAPHSKIDIYEAYVGNKIWGSGYADQFGSWNIILSEDLPEIRFGLVANDGNGWSNNRYIQVARSDSAADKVVHEVTGRLNEIVPFVDKILGLIRSGAYTPPSGGRSGIPLTGDVVGVALNIYKDIKEYGFIWNRTPDTTRHDRTGVILTVDANTRTPQNASVAVSRDWLVSFVSSSVTFPVPIPLPADTWEYAHHGYCKAGGDTNYPIASGDNRFPFNGPGAYVGQLVYKFGEEGKALPIYNEHYASTLNEQGELYLRMNIPDERLTRCYGALQVYVGTFRPSGELVFVTVIPDSGWVRCGITRHQNWDKIVHLGNSSEPIFMSLDAPAVSRKNNWGAPALTTTVASISGDCGPAGVSEKLISIVGDTSYPYSGPGARYGQLIYKWGENGTPLPAWHSEERGEQKTGDIFLRMNDRGDSMYDNQSSRIHVIVS
ncbi:hypothetical protein [Pseudomonas sp. P97.38]|uniref:hypothetical protein n=1 Tax=Pseudomonas sp. P97.38 TaxID=255451 RepID=UPI000B121F13|nr:hypothetical protein [Pseudomonas sp. P97.38]